MREVEGIVDIQGNARQVHDVWRNAARLGSGEMREETVLAKAQGHRVGRREKDRVRAALVMRGDDRERWRRAVRGDNAADLRRRDERDVAGQGQHAAASLAGEAPRRGSNGPGVAGVSPLFHALGAVTGGEKPRRRVGRDQQATGKTGQFGHRRQHIFEHCQRQRLAQPRRQGRREALLRGRCVLDRDNQPDSRCGAHLRTRSAAARTVRASASRSARVCINVRASTTGMSSPATAARSSSSAI